MANVHSIETFSGVDGPGIRYVLFLQGCNMQCLYCHNADAISQREAKLMTVEEIVEDFRHYQNFYQNGGGITLSGGEPLLQVKFIIELFRLLKSEGVHTCIETQGSLFQNNAEIEELISLTDLFIVDLKGSDEGQAFSISRCGIRRTLIFLNYLNQLNKKVIITYVLLPTLNDREKDCQQLANILFQYNDRNVSFKVLPYHRLGVHKWKDMGIEYTLDHIEEPTQLAVHEFLSKIRTYLLKQKSL